MNSTFNFSGKTALITGGVSGIGAAAASLAFKQVASVLGAEVATGI